MGEWVISVRTAGGANVVVLFRQMHCGCKDGDDSLLPSQYLSNGAVAVGRTKQNDRRNGTVVATAAGHAITIGVQA